MRNKRPAGVHWEDGNCGHQDDVLRVYRGFMQLCAGILKLPRRTSHPCLGPPRLHLPFLVPTARSLIAISVASSIDQHFRGEKEKEYKKNTEKTNGLDNDGLLVLNRVVCISERWAMHLIGLWSPIFWVARFLHGLENAWVFFFHFRQGWKGNKLLCTAVGVWWTYISIYG